ncbi:hypothetical protein V8D89_006575 [Ganoderma adspersum]
MVQINERILTLKSLHNAVTPINAKLPSEILIHIFRHVEPNVYQDIQLSHVCRLWRSALHQAAEFWVDILSSIRVIDRPHGHQLFKDFFERTAPLPFGLFLKSGELSLIRQLPINHLLRVNLLSITFSHDTLTDLRDLIHLGLPSLRQLTCEYQLSRQLEQFDAMVQIRNAHSSDNFPQLVFLNIHGKCITPAFFVASLRDVYIFGAAVVSPVLILNALRACLDLESLAIEDIHEESVGAQALADLGPPVPMEKLTLLTLSSNPGKPFASAFLSHLQYPSTTRIKIIGQGTTLSEYLCYSSPLISTPASSTVQRVVFTLTPNHDEDLSLCEVKGSSDVSPNRLSMSLRYGPWDFDLPSGHDHARRFLDFANVFSSSQAPVLTNATFNLEHGLSIPYEDWHTVLLACSQIRHFAVSIASCRGLLRALRRHHLLPQLETLSITCENGSGVHESLVSAIESRAAMGVSRLDELRFYTEWLARRKENDDFPSFSTSRLARLKAHVRDVYIGAKDAAP